MKEQESKTQIEIQEKKEEGTEFNPLTNFSFLFDELSNAMKL